MRATRDERVPLEAIGVVRMERLAELEHHIVRDVDRVVDRSHPGRDQSVLHPLRRWSDGHVLEVRRTEPPAPVGILDPDDEALRVELVAELRDRWLAQRDALHRRELARDTDDAHTVGPIGLKLEDEDRIAERISQRLAHSQCLVEDEDALVIVAEAELLLGTDHPLAEDAAHLLRL